jgi:hypothetical protein
MPASQALADLVNLYRTKPIEFPQLRAVSLAQWILESGWGGSELARLHNNFAGMKWRNEMKPYAEKIKYNAHDGSDFYCRFHDHANFAAGYWAFMDRAPYAGWRDHVSTGEQFIAFIGPIWAQDGSYVGKVLNLVPDAEKLLATGAQGVTGAAAGFVCEACGNEHDAAMADLAVHASSGKPHVDRWEPTSHKSSRNGTDIDHVVIHYTTSRNIEGTIEHFKNGNPETSAHYIVGQDGALVQMVDDSDRAWHAGNSLMNARSIGIEHVAAVGDKITDAQARKSIALVRWLMNEYDVPKANVIPHVCVKPTSCCGDLFADFGGGAGKPCNTQRQALHAWMSAQGI